MPPPVSLGLFVKRLIGGRGISQTQLASDAGMREAQLSKLLKGGSVQSKFYEAVAKALKYRTALEMFRAPDDAKTRQLLRLWAALEGNEPARKGVLDLMKAAIAGDEESSAT